MRPYPLFGVLLGGVFSWSIILTAAESESGFRVYEKARAEMEKQVHTELAQSVAPYRSPEEIMRDRMLQSLESEKPREIGPTKTEKSKDVQERLKEPEPVNADLAPATVIDQKPEIPAMQVLPVKEELKPEALPIPVVTPEVRNLEPIKKESVTKPGQRLSTEGRLAKPAKKAKAVTKKMSAKVARAPKAIGMPPLVVKNKIEKSTAEIHLHRVINKKLPTGILETDSEADYYVDLGSANGIHPKSTVDVYRKVRINNDVDPTQSYDLVVRVGRLKAIQVQKNLSVMRVAEMFADQKGSPQLDAKSIMVGDIVIPQSQSGRLALAIEERTATPRDRVHEKKRETSKSASHLSNIEVKLKAQQPTLKSNIIEIVPPSRPKK